VQSNSKIYISDNRTKLIYGISVTGVMREVSPDTKMLGDFCTRKGDIIGITFNKIKR
jgi:hypothetical protein